MFKPSQKQVDVFLVNMPFFEVSRPSLALGLLHAALEDTGVCCKTVYANMEFIDSLGMDASTSLPAMRPEDGVMEWIFSTCIFPDHNMDPTELVHQVQLRNKKLRNFSFEKLHSTLCRLQSHAAIFLEDLVDRLLARSPVAVCCSSTFAQHTASLALLYLVKSRCQEVVTVIGGANCEGSMGKKTFETFPWIDLLVSGEADDLFPALINGATVQKAETLHFSGVYSRISNIKTSTGEKSVKRRINYSLDSLLTPNYDDYLETLERLPAIRKKITPGFLFEASRGCWWGEKKGCCFCGLNGQGKSFREKSSLKVLDELDFLHKRYAITRFAATDNILGMSFFDTLLPELKRRGAPYTLFFETKSSLTKEQVRLLREAGVIWIQPGIESLNSKALRLMNKGCMAWQNIAMLQHCMVFGVRASWNILYNFPGEKDNWYQDMAEIFPLLTHLQPPSGAHKVRYDRFSSYFDNPEEYNLNLVPAAPFSLVYAVEDNVLKDLVYFFDDYERLIQEQDPILSVVLERPGVKAVDKQVRKWIGAFYSETRPKLQFEDQNGVLRIQDTRGCRMASAYELQGAERNVLLSCMAPSRRNTLKRLHSNLPMYHGQLINVLDSLVEKKLLLEIDDGFLSLPITEPSCSFPAADSFPGGVGF